MDIFKISFMGRLSWSFLTLFSSRYENSSSSITSGDRSYSYLKATTTSLESSGRYSAQTRLTTTSELVATSATIMLHYSPPVVAGHNINTEMYRWCWLVVVVGILSKVLSLSFKKSTRGIKTEELDEEIVEMSFSRVFVNSSVISVFIFCLCVFLRWPLQNYWNNYWFFFFLFLLQCTFL